MQVFKNKEAAQKPTAVALGFFDGVHLGHRAVVDAVLHAAEEQGLLPAVFTFSLEGATAGKGKRLQSDAAKHATLAQLGVQYCFEPPFESFRSLSPEAFFTQILLGQCGAKAVACGDNFHFGQNRAGDIQTLKALCKAHGVAFLQVPTTLWQDAPVSSSRIRAALAAGDIPSANAMLGRPYAISLPVKRGRGIGGTLGFPTINQAYPEWMQQPQHGVYVTRAIVNGTAWPSATGLGNRPTVNGKHVTCETFLPGFSGDLYDTEVTVGFYQKIADTQRFASPEALAEAVQSWARQALDFFKG